MQSRLEMTKSCTLSWLRSQGSLPLTKKRAAGKKKFQQDHENEPSLKGCGPLVECQQSTAESQLCHRGGRRLVCVASQFFSPAG